MADDNDQNETNAQPPQTAPATQSAPAITPEIQALIDAEREKARNAAWAEARRTFESKQKPAAQPSKTETAHTAPVQPQTVDVRAEVNRIRSFERAANRFGLSDAALSVLEQDFNAANPPDPAAWVQQRAEAFGWKTANSNPQPSTPAPAPAQPAAQNGTPPPVMPGGTPPARTVPDDMPILAMSEADKLALQKRIGPWKFRERLFSELRTQNVRVARK